MQNIEKIWNSLVPHHISFKQTFRSVARPPPHHVRSDISTSQEQIAARTLILYRTIDDRYFATINCVNQSRNWWQFEKEEEEAAIPKPKYLFPNRCRRRPAPHAAIRRHTRKQIRMELNEFVISGAAGSGYKLKGPRIISAVGAPKG